MKIAFYGTKSYDRSCFEKEFLAYGHSAKFFEMHLTTESSLLARGCDCVCVSRNEKIDENVINQLCNYGVRYMLVRGMTSSNIDEMAAVGRITIITASHYSHESIAEYAFGLLLTSSRQIHRSYVRTKDYNTSLSGLMGTNVQGKVVGIIGMGKVGRRVAEMYTCFGAKVIAFDHNKKQVEGYTFVPLEEIFETADIISLHVPTTKATYHLINQYSLSVMKRGVRIVSTAGGGVINYDELASVLRVKGKIGSVAIDYNDEEKIYMDEQRVSHDKETSEDDSGEEADFDVAQREDVILKLATYNNVIVTNHLSHFTAETLEIVANTLVSKMQEYEAKTE